MNACVRGCEHEMWGTDVAIAARQRRTRMDESGDRRDRCGIRASRTSSAPKPWRLAPDRSIEVVAWAQSLGGGGRDSERPGSPGGGEKPRGEGGVRGEQKNGVGVAIPTRSHCGEREASATSESGSQQSGSTLLFGFRLFLPCGSKNICRTQAQEFGRFH